MRKINVEVVIVGLDELNSQVYYCVNKDYDVPQMELTFGGQDNSLSIAYKLSKDTIIAAPMWYDVMQGGFADSPDGTLHLIYQVFVNTRVSLKEGYSWKPFQEIWDKAPSKTVVLNIATQGQK